MKTEPKRMTEIADLNILLKILNEKDLHVHEMPIDNREIFKAAKKMWDPKDTHYVMKGSTVIHIGTPYTIERFAHSYDETKTK